MAGDRAIQTYTVQVSVPGGREWRTATDRVVVVSTDAAGGVAVVTDPKGRFPDVDTGHGPGRWQVPLDQLAPIAGRQPDLFTGNLR